MCRWLAYTGDPILLEDMLFKAEHSLIDQSMAAHSSETPTNGDGFGIGWYDRRESPGLFRSIRPAWNDLNLRDLSGHIESPLFLAHVRAASLASVQETNCHPFRYKKWLFVHNGEIHNLEHIRRDLLLAVAPGLFPCIQGTTDSELMFYLALTFGLEADPLGALARMAGLIEETARRKGTAEPLWMTLGVSNGKVIYAVRYSSAGEAPSLHYSHDIEDICELNPRLEGYFSPFSRVVVSEPMGSVVEAWVHVPEDSCLRVAGGDVEVRPFRPVRPA